MGNGMDAVTAQTHLDTMNKVFTAIQDEFGKGPADIEVRLARPGDFDDIADGTYVHNLAVAGDNVGILDFDPIQRPYAIMFAGLTPGNMFAEFGFIRITIDETIAREWFGGFFNDPDSSTVYVPDPVFALRSKSVITNYNTLQINAAARFHPYILMWMPRSGGVSA